MVGKRQISLGLASGDGGKNTHTTHYGQRATRDLHILLSLKLTGGKLKVIVRLTANLTADHFFMETSR